MSDVSKFFGDIVGGVGEFGRNNWRTVGDVEQALTGSRRLSSRSADKIADFYNDEIVDKKELRGAETETFLSGLPIIGGVIRGAEGINQIEDLYAKTGKLPAYPGASGPGASGIGSALGQLSRKIEDGHHDLASFYSGEDVNNERMWQYMTKNWNARPNNGPF